MEVKILEDGSIQITFYHRRRWIIEEATDTWQVTEQLNDGRGDAYTYSDISVTPVRGKLGAFQHVGNICRKSVPELSRMVQNARKR